MEMQCSGSTGFRKYSTGNNTEFLECDILEMQALLETKAMAISRYTRPWKKCDFKKKGYDF